jgi:hypothetical protein
MMIDDLPEEVFDLGRQLPEFVRKNVSSSMSPWEVKASILYNPDLKFIDFAMPGIVGLILQLLTVTLALFVRVPADLFLPCLSGN